MSLHSTLQSPRSNQFKEGRGLLAFVPTSHWAVSGAPTRRGVGELRAGGRFRYSDLKEAAPVLRHLCILNGARVPVCCTHAIADGLCGAIRAWYPRRRVVERVPASALSILQTGSHWRRSRDFLPVLTDVNRARSDKPGHAAHLAVCGGARSISSAAEIRSSMCMVPPQTGHCQHEPD